MASPFYHQPLSTTDSIRIVGITPNHDLEAQVHCTVSEYSLAQPLEPFEALAYAWGDASDKIPIMIGDNNQYLPITRNFLNALKSLRRRDKVRLIWIDAICIN
ncbi:hypothetical protein QBC35DRAFT_453520 [Podospora australis]|uniref:Heterokaryon incompatibility domain-containing protein n=1 Tax=Podospora australis TaxID=1536484 RepID=A0AAN6WR66_9PEZI|nr:hypothetical protein QBC35DRAFT_453520 [Podospora australis]